MKSLKIFILCILLASCGAVEVTTDYDSGVDFTNYKTFAFYKPGIDKAAISDLDKKRVLRALESELTSKGFVKSTTPDFLVSIFAKSRERVNVNNNIGPGWGWGFGWGMNPWMWGGNMNNLSITQFTEGTLFVDFIDKEKNELIWQGIGTGALKIQNRAKKEERIQLFVKEIVSNFPPEIE